MYDDKMEELEDSESPAFRDVELDDEERINIRKNTTENNGLIFSVFIFFAYVGMVVYFGISHPIGVKTTEKSVASSHLIESHTLMFDVNMKGYIDNGYEVSFQLYRNDTRHRLSFKSHVKQEIEEISNGEIVETMNNETHYEFIFDFERRRTNPIMIYKCYKQNINEINIQLNFMHGLTPVDGLVFTSHHSDHDVALLSKTIRLIIAFLAVYVAISTFFVSKYDYSILICLFILLSTNPTNIKSVDMILVELFYGVFRTSIIYFVIRFSFTLSSIYKYFIYGAGVFMAMYTVYEARSTSGMESPARVYTPFVLSYKGDSLNDLLYFHLGAFVLYLVIFIHSLVYEREVRIHSLFFLLPSLTTVIGCFLPEQYQSTIVPGVLQYVGYAIAAILIVLYQNRFADYNEEPINSHKREMEDDVSLGNEEGTDSLEF